MNIWKVKFGNWDSANFTGDTIEEVLTKARKYEETEILSDFKKKDLEDMKADCDITEIVWVAGADE